MYRVTVRCYEELNDYLPPERRKREFAAAFEEKRSVKNLLESLGVPHTEIDLILINGESVGFDYPLRDGDRVSAYPVFETLPVADVTRLRPTPLRVTRFVCDVHLKTLAKRLRLLGFDTAFDAAADDDLLEHTSFSERRILLTQDRQLLMRRSITHGMHVRSSDPERQVCEVLDRFHLRGECKPFTRCTECNGMLHAVEDPLELEALRTRIPDGVWEWCREYHVCEACGQVYWPGTHWERLKQKVKGYLEENTDSMGPAS